MQSWSDTGRINPKFKTSDHRGGAGVADQILRSLEGPWIMRFMTIASPIDPRSFRGLPNALLWSSRWTMSKPAVGPRFGPILVVALYPVTMWHLSGIGSLWCRASTENVFFLTRFTLDPTDTTGGVLPRLTVHLSLWLSVTSPHFPRRSGGLRLLGIVIYSGKPHSPTNQLPI